MGNKFPEHSAAQCRGVGSLPSTRGAGLWWPTLRVYAAVYVLGHGPAHGMAQADGAPTGGQYPPMTLAYWLGRRGVLPGRWLLPK